MVAHLTLLLMAGMPGAGKSTVALALGRALGWPVIDKDTLVSTLLDAGIAEEVAQPATYALLFALGRDFLVQQRRSVILDSPAGLDVTVEHAVALAQSADARLRVILCLTDQETRNRRVAARARKRSQPITHSRTAGDGRSRFDHLPADTIVVQTDQPLAVIIEQLVALIQN